MLFKNGQTALITGASSGIGIAFARLLAKQGVHLTLVARRLDRLQNLAAELNTTYGVEVHPLEADLSTEEGIRRAEQMVAAAERLDLLINNAGFGLNGSFPDLPPERIMDMLNCHVTAVTRLCRAALPAMLAAGSGGIINVSSVAAFTPEFSEVGYSSTKAFINVFSRALQSEVAVSGVYIQALCPGFTHTGFHATPAYAGVEVEKNIPAFLWMQPEQVAAYSLKQLGQSGVICVPGLINRWMVLAANMGITGLLAPLRRRLKKQVFVKRDVEIVQGKSPDDVE